jgi:hypothetical protein
MTVSIKTAVFLDVTPRDLINTFRHSRAMYPLRVQVRRVSRLKVSLIAVPACPFPVPYLTLM